MQDSVQVIKSKLDIQDVVAPYVQLKKAGRYMKAVCPFHQEKTPSFYVSPERQLAYCFSCQKGGDMFQFIQDIEGLDFRGALELLAEKASVELKKYRGKPSVSKDLRENLKTANKEASKFFVQQLWSAGPAEKVLKYLRSRGVTDEIIKEFQVGFAPDGKDILYRHLLNKKLGKDHLITSSLVIAKDSEGRNIRDRFRLRLMFPISSVQGNIIAFGGRALKSGDNPKYLNSPEYVLYNKGSVLYNLDKAKKVIREKDMVIFVEGYFDVMASHQAGIKNVVATSGTALTEQQFKLIKRYTKKVVLAFDSDSAGEAALLRAVKTAQPLGLEVFVVDIPEGKDTADAVKEDPQLWVNAVEAKVSYLQYFLDKWQQDLNSSSGKREFSDKILDLLKGVKHPVERDHFIKVLSKLVGTPVDMLYDYLKQLGKERKTRRVKDVIESAPKKSKHDRLVSYFMGMLLAFPGEFISVWESNKHFDDFIKRANEIGMIKQMSKLNPENYESFVNDFQSFINSPEEQFDASSVYKQVIDHYNTHAEVKEGFYASLDQADLLLKLAFEAEIKNRDANTIENEFTKLITLLYFEFIS